MICTAFWVGWGLNFNVKLFYYLDRIIYNIVCRARSGVMLYGM